MTTPPAPPAAQPLFPHTLAGPFESSGATLGQPRDYPPVDTDALCDLFDRSMSAVMYLDRRLNDADKQTVFSGHQLVTEYDAVRGVDAVRHATPDELAAAG